MNEEQERAVNEFVETGVSAPYQDTPQVNYEWMYQREKEVNERLQAEIAELTSTDRLNSLKLHCLELASRAQNVDDHGIAKPLNAVQIVDGAKLMLNFINQ